MAVGAPDAAAGLVQVGLVAMEGPGVAALLTAAAVWVLSVTLEGAAGWATDVGAVVKAVATARARATEGASAAAPVLASTSSGL